MYEKKKHNEKMEFSTDQVWHWKVHSSKESFISLCSFVHYVCDFYLIIKHYF